MKSDVTPIHLDIAITELPADPMGADKVRSVVERHARGGVQCRKHAAPLREIRVHLTPGKSASVDCVPCCRRTVKDLKSRLAKLKAIVDDRVVSSAPEGHRLIRHDDPLAPDAARAQPPPFRFGGSGTRAVSRDVAALYAEAGRLEHVVRLNGADSDIDAYTLESLDADARARGMPDKWPPALTPENIRRYTREIIANVLEQALQEGHPLSSYAATFDWDKQVASAWRSSELRELLVEAADCPTLVEELDASGDDTLLLFLFANNRYDRTLKVTSRGFMVGSAGTS